jgi:hypothetical protein
MELPMLTNKDKMYRLLPIQIVRFWDAIKFACKQVDEVKEEDYPNYFNDLLQALLSDKAQCFVVLDENRILYSIAITRIVADKIQNRKELNIQCLYSMKPWTDEAAKRYFAFTVQFAKQVECTAVVFSSRNPRIWDMARKEGSCVERTRTFSFTVGGD